MTNRMLLSITILGLAALCAEAVPANAASPSLAGSWKFMLTPTTPTPSPQIPGLATFTSDGSMIESDGLEVVVKAPSTVSGGFNSPGHGIWQLGPSMTFYYVQYISVVVNQNGSLNSTNTTTMTLTPNSTGTAFSGTYSTQLATAMGKILKTTTGTVSGQLIPHPALP